jgi:hypothetical protein
MAPVEHADPLDAPTIEIAAAPKLAFIPNKDWDREREAFYRMLPDLLPTYRDKYVAILGGGVVGHGDASRQVSLEAHRRYGEVPIYIGLVSEQPAAPIRIPSFRIVSR